QLAIGEDEVRVTAALRDLPGCQVVGRIMQSDGCPFVAQQRRVARGIAGVAIRYAVLLQQKSVTEARDCLLTPVGLFGEIVRVVLRRSLIGDPVNLRHRKSAQAQIEMDRQGGVDQQTLELDFQKVLVPQGQLRTTV